MSKQRCLPNVGVNPAVRTQRENGYALPLERHAEYGRRVIRSDTHGLHVLHGRMAMLPLRVVFVPSIVYAKIDSEHL